MSDASKMPARFSISFENGRYFVSIPNYSGGEVVRSDIAEQMAEALRIIAGRQQCTDNLMGNVDVAEAALTAWEASNG